MVNVRVSRAARSGRRGSCLGRTRRSCNPLQNASWLLPQPLQQLVVCIRSIEHARRMWGDCDATEAMEARYDGAMTWAAPLWRWSSTITFPCNAAGNLAVPTQADHV